ncbi:MAG: protein translocase subunit SecD, partial [Campylobacterota bacterium]
MKFNFRLIILALATVFGLVFSAPSLLQLDSGKKVTLGLDLQGGLHMLLGVKTDEAIASRIKSIAASVKNFSEKKDIIIDSFSFNEESVTVTLLDKDEVKNIKNFISEIKGSVVTVQDTKISISLTKEEILRTQEQAVSQTVETIRNRLDQFGLSEPTVTRQGENQILVELAGIKTADEEQRARELISRSAKLELMAVDEDRVGRANSMSEADAASYGDVILEDANNPKIKHLVREIPILDGSMLTDAHVGFDQNNRPLINFTLNAEGAGIFGDFTSKSIGKRLAVVLDGKVYSAPV